MYLIMEPEIDILCARKLWEVIQRNLNIGLFKGFNRYSRVAYVIVAKRIESKFVFVDEIGCQMTNFYLYFNIGIYLFCKVLIKIIFFSWWNIRLEIGSTPDHT